MMDFYVLVSVEWEIWSGFPGWLGLHVSHEDATMVLLGPLGSLGSLDKSRGPVFKAGAPMAGKYVVCVNFAQGVHLVTTCSLSPCHTAVHL